MKNRVNVQIGIATLNDQNFQNNYDRKTPQKHSYGCKHYSSQPSIPFATGGPQPVCFYVLPIYPICDRQVSDTRFDRNKW
jgi:hypothetical protein